MSQLTPEIIQRGRGADPNEIARRRRANRELQATREKLTSTTGLERAFDYELLRQFAETRRNAATVMVLLAAVVGAASSIWISPPLIVLWLALITTALSVGFLMVTRFRKAAPEEALAPAWRLRFTVADLIQGGAWAVLLVGLYRTDSSSAQTFLLFLSLLITAVIAMLAANLPSAVFAGIGPLTVAILASLARNNSIEWITMAAVAMGGQLYFVILSNRLYSSTVATLEFRAEKDALIAELEQAKANSDEARRRAEEANIAKSHFLATMSHELRTPLNAIMGFSEVMKGELFGQHQVPAYREYSNDIYNSGKLLLDIINEILDLSRIEAGRYELKEEAVSLAHVVEDCRHMLQMRAKNRSISIREMIEPRLPKLWADERAIRQVALNLLSNAIKFTPSGGDVTIKVGWTSSGGQYLSVKDTGPGIPEEEIPIVLQSFGRGSLAIKTAEQGTGLGLPIVKGLMDMHGGQLILNSKLREGTEVIITFPPSRVMDTLAPLQEPERAETHAASSRRAAA
ncbi:two-component sensor histidine kinase [Alsobacter soli]|uniref:histidine kinase n=1 Tax=Alsobacter soli TaxID=2109933 RepID=A0A2T1HVS6_9HYPH|nr:ATP-binding protein [Alsobacter soli]PSC05763.1 two-component sensor histidine kinase [Alsobacter soli]